MGLSVNTFSSSPAFEHVVLCGPHPSLTPRLGQGPVMELSDDMSLSWSPSQFPPHQDYEPLECWDWMGLGHCSVLSTQHRSRTQQLLN